MARKRGSDVEVGDILMFLSTPHRITRIEPYLHPTLRLPGWRTAYADTGERAYKNAWGITLEPQCEYEIV